MKTHCVHGHKLSDATTFVQRKLHRPNGRWYDMRGCRVCRAIDVSAEWYMRERRNRCGNYYSGAPMTLREIERRVERRWEKRLGEKIRD